MATPTPHMSRRRIIFFILAFAFIMTFALSFVLAATGTAYFGFAPQLQQQTWTGTVKTEYPSCPVNNPCGPQYWLYATDGNIYLLIFPSTTPSSNSFIQVTGTYSPNCSCATTGFCSCPVQLVGTPIGVITVTSWQSIGAIFSTTSTGLTTYTTNVIASSTYTTVFTSSSTTVTSTFTTQVSSTSTSTALTTVTTPTTSTTSGAITVEGTFETASPIPFIFATNGKTYGLIGSMQSVVSGQTIIVTGTLSTPSSEGYTGGDITIQSWQTITATTSTTSVSSSTTSSSSSATTNTSTSQSSTSLSLSSTSTKPTYHCIAIIQLSDIFANAHVYPLVSCNSVLMLSPFAVNVPATNLQVDWVMVIIAILGVIFLVIALLP